MIRPMAPAIRLVWNGLLTELCTYHLGTELFQLYREREPIRMEEASFSASLMACHTTDDCACRL